METRKILGRSDPSAMLRTSLRYVLVLGLMVWPVALSEAGPMGTAFTYQGRLIDANYPADGLYDFQFKLYDSSDPCAGNQVGGDVNVPDMDVIDGYFTVLLEFNDANAFNGDARWLQIGVRPGILEDPNDYNDLDPRQEVTAAPYALYAANASADSDWMISGNNMYSIPSGNVGIGTMQPQVRLSLGAEEPPMTKKLAIWDGVDDFYGFGVDWDKIMVYAGNNVGMTIRDNNYVGIGTTDPQATLHIKNDTPVVHFEESDANNKKWTIAGWNSGLVISEPGVGDWVYVKEGGNVGIGTTGPSHLLEVAGDAHVEGELSWQAKTGYISVSAAAFRPSVPGYIFSQNGWYLINVDGLSENYYAPVQLPHGATVEKLTFYWNDTSAFNGKLDLWRKSFGGSQGSMALVYTAGSSGDGSSYDDSISNATIDNSQNSYFLFANLKDSNMRLYGAVIEYTFSTP